MTTGILRLTTPRVIDASPQHIHIYMYTYISPPREKESVCVHVYTYIYDTADESREGITREAVTVGLRFIFYAQREG